MSLSSRATSSSQTVNANANAAVARYPSPFYYIYWFYLKFDIDEPGTNYIALWNDYTKHIPSKMREYEALIGNPSDLALFGRDVRHFRTDERLRTECYDWECYQAALKLWNEKFGK